MFRYITPVLFIALCMSLPSAAQKAKDKRVDIKYVALPSEKLPADFTTYSVEVSGGNIAMGGLDQLALEKSIKMDGFKRVGDTNENEFGHLRIRVNTGTISTGRLGLKSRTDSYKNDKGEVIKTTYYWYELPYSGVTSYKIVDPDGNILFTDTDSHNSAAKSREEKASSILSKEYDSLYSSLRRSSAASVANWVVGVAQNTLRARYDFDHVTDDPQFYTIKRHDQEDLFESHLEKTISVFKSLPATATAADGLKQMDASIQFWKKHTTAHPGKDKDLQEVYLACNSNLAHTYFYLDQFEDASKHAKMVLAVDEKEKRIERLVETMAKAKERMAFHGINSMRYSRDLTNAVPPSKVKALEAEKEQLQADNNSLPGMLIIGQDTVQGIFVRAKADEDFIFGPSGNTKFMQETATGMKEHELTSEQVSEFQIGQRKFIRTTFSPCAKGKSEPANHLLEELYFAEKIRLYKYYPVSGVLSNAQPEFAYQKQSDAVPISLLDTRFLLWDKGMATYFSDCSDLQSLCSTGGFKMNEDDLVKAARVYAEICP